jgi:hypothetical protein
MATRSLPLDLDIVVYSATSFKRELIWLPDGLHPQDFTGWSARMLIGQPVNVADVVLTSGDSITLTADGKIIIKMTPAQTTALRQNVTFYNLDLTEPDGFIRRFLRGRVSVVVDVRPVI